METFPIVLCYFPFCCNEIWSVLLRELQLCVMPTVFCCRHVLHINGILSAGAPALQCGVRWCCWRGAVQSLRRTKVCFLSLVWLLIYFWLCHKEFSGGGDGSKSFCNLQRLWCLSFPIHKARFIIASKYRAGEYLQERDWMQACCINATSKNCVWFWWQDFYSFFLKKKKIQNIFF